MHNFSPNIGKHKLYIVMAINLFIAKILQHQDEKETKRKTLSLLVPNGKSLPPWEAIVIIDCNFQTRSPFSSTQTNFILLIDVMFS